MICVYGGHRAELERVAADADRAQIVEPVQVDEHVRRCRTGLHHVHERLAAGECASAFVRCQEPDRLVDRSRPRILDFTEKHRGD